MVAVICVACGTGAGSAAAFCSACGTVLTVPAKRRPAAGGAGWHRPGRPELKQVTILVTDLVDSTELVAALDAESAMDRLDPILRTMADAAAKFGGTVVSTHGDGIMAVFGAPVALEGHAVLACRAALAIRTALTADPAGLSVRTGLHSGEIVAHTTARDAETSSAFGMALHVASRLPPQVHPNGICLTESCFRLLRGYGAAAPLGPRRLRGVPRPMLLYALERLGTDDAPHPGELTPFLGRENELDVLDGCLARMRAGQGAVVCIAGAPGSGKSRLCFEFAKRCRRLSISVVEARSQPFGGTATLKPVADLLRAAYFAIAPGDLPGPARQAVADRLAALGGGAPGDLALMCDLLGIPGDEAVHSFMSAASRRTRLIGIVERLVRQRGEMPLVLLLEDLHWLDAASFVFVAALARATAGTRTMLLLNRRLAEPELPLDLPRCHHLVLAELGHNDTKRLVARLLGPVDGLDAIRERVAKCSGGNPFFAEELVRSLLEERIVVGRPGAYRRGHAPDRKMLPATVRAVIGGRVDQLPAPEREMLQVAAVIGEEFDLPVLHAVAERVGEAGAVRSAVEGLCDASMLRRVGTAWEGRYSFRHPLIQDVVYSTQLKSRRSVVHAAVARALERVSLDRREDLSGVIAFHFEEAGEAGKAAIFAARAARRVGQTDAVAAVRQWRKVHALLAGQPRTPQSDVLRIEANAQIGWLGWREGLPAAEARPFLEEALVWARETDASTVPLLILIEGRINQGGEGDADRFVAWVREAIALAERDGDAGRTATLQAQLSHACGWAGLLHEALVANDAALVGADQVGAFDQQLLGYSVRHWAEGLRGRILLRLGRIDEARACFDPVIAMAETIDPTISVIAFLGYVELGAHLRDAPLAAHHAAGIAALADKYGSSYLRLYRMLTDAMATATAGQAAQAADQIRGALAYLHGNGVARELEPELRARLAEYLFDEGRYEAAASEAMEAIALAQERHSRLPHCRALVTLALAAGKGVPGIDSRAALTQARALMHASGARLNAAALDAAWDQIEATP